MSNIRNTDSWDVFISYASEDRLDVAEPLATTLQRMGLSVWFDQSELKLGDSLRESIDKGLRSCRFGVVILSPYFFRKHYTNRELNGLAQREVDGNKVILPVWYKVTDKEVRVFSPPLADKVAARWNDGLQAVAQKIHQAVRPELAREVNQLAKSIQEPIPALRSGNDLLSCMDKVHILNLANEVSESENEIDLMARFHQELQGWRKYADHLSLGNRIRAEFQIKSVFKRLEAVGWKVFGAQHQQRLPSHAENTLSVANIFIAHGNAQKALVLGDGSFAVFHSHTSDAIPDRFTQYKTTDQVLEILLRDGDSGSTPRLQKGGSAGTPEVCDMVPAFSYQFEGFGWVTNEFTSSQWHRKASRTVCCDLPERFIYSLIDEALASPSRAARLMMEGLHIIHDDDYDDVNDVTDSSSGTFRSRAYFDFHLDLAPTPVLSLNGIGHLYRMQYDR